MTVIKKCTIATVCIATLGMLIASFYDYQIDVSLFDPDNVFANTITNIGAWIWLLPATSGLLFGATIRGFRQIKLPYLLLIAIVLAFCALYLYTILLGVSLTSWWHMRKYVWLIRLFVLFTSFAIIGWCCARGNLERTLIVGIVGCLLLLLSNILIIELKHLWGRQRFYTFTDPSTQFSPWYLPPMTNLDLGDMYMSFPSGHSNAAMTLIWLSMLPSIFWAPSKRVRVLTVAIAAATIIITLLVMWSRLVLGMHFLSDTIAGASLTLLIFLVLSSVGNKITLLKTEESN